MRTLEVKILRIQAGREKDAYFQKFKVGELPGMTVLALLQKIRAEITPTIYFDASCRSAICGSCAMMINGVPRLACKTQTSSLPEKIKLEPLAGFPVIRDLAIDKEKFFADLNREKIEGWIHFKREFNPKMESPMDDKTAEKIYKADKCVECGICVAGCLSAKLGGNFIGAAGLNKALRFVLDPRDIRTAERIPALDENLANCHGIGDCENLCPKEIKLSEQIGSLRRKAILEKLKSNYELLWLAIRVLTRKLFFRK